MASLSLAFDILARDNASKVFKDVGNAADDTGKKGSKLAGVLGAAKGGVAAAAAVAGTALVAFGASSISAASDLEQSSGAVESVFGKASTAVKAFADTSAERLGLAKSEYQDLAAVVGSQLQRMGESQDESAVSTDKLIGLASDLAATFGGSVSDAVSAVGALLRGERDPIEKYGVGISDANVEAGLAAKGLENLEGKAKDQAKAQETLSQLFDQTKNSTGAFARESDTLAGAQTRLKAKFEDVKAKVGEALLPALTDLASKVLDLIDGFEKGTGAGGDLKETFDKVKQTFIDNKPEIVALGKALLDIGEFLATKVFPVLVQLYGTELKLLVDAFGLVKTVLVEVSQGFLSMAGVFLGGLKVIFEALAKVPGPFQENFKAASAAVGVAKSSVDALKVAIDVAAKPKTAKVAASVKGTNDVNSLGSAVKRLQNKTITVTTIERRVVEMQRAAGKGNVPGFANGGILPRGLAMVGERGPELIATKGGDRVFSNEDSKKILSGGNTYNINVAAVDSAQLVSTLKRLEALNG